MYILWIIVLITTVLAEAATCALISVWFALGALAALIAVVLGAGFAVQLAVFLAVSVITLAVTRPVVKRSCLKTPQQTASLISAKKQ